MKSLIIAALLTCSSVFAAEYSLTLKEENTVVFNMPVTSAYAANKAHELFQKHSALKKNKPIYLVLDTPGGSVSAGLRFIEAAKSINRPVHTVTIFAASMGYQIVQSLNNRYISPTGTLMAHRGYASGMEGQIPGELNTRVEYLTIMLDDMTKTAAKRIGMSEAKYSQAIINERWKFGADAIKSNEADRVVNIKCSPELMSGITQEQVMTMFGPINVSFSKCPLVSGPITVDASQVLQKDKVQGIIDSIINKRNHVYLDIN